MNDSPALLCVDPKEIGVVWHHIEPVIADAFKRFGSRDERRQLEDDIKTGSALAWIVWSNDRQIEAVLITDLVTDDGDKVCRLRALAGSHRERWVSLIQQVEQFARNEQCKCVRYVGRPGWHTVLTDYRVTHVIAEKRLG